jgi:hypothetical protein
MHDVDFFRADFLLMLDQLPMISMVGYGNQVAAATFDYEPVQDAALLPPVHLKNWLIKVWQQ